MARLRGTSKGQVTLKKEVLDHMGVRAGDDVEVDLLPSGRLSVKGPDKGRIEDFFRVAGECPRSPFYYRGDE